MLGAKDHVLMVYFGHKLACKCRGAGLDHLGGPFLCSDDVAFARLPLVPHLGLFWKQQTGNQGVVGPVVKMN